MKNQNIKKLVNKNECEVIDFSKFKPCVDNTNTFNQEDFEMQSSALNLEVMQFEEVIQSLLEMKKKVICFDNIVKNGCIVKGRIEDPEFAKEIIDILIPNFEKTIKNLKQFKKTINKKYE